MVLLISVYFCACVAMMVHVFGFAAAHLFSLVLPVMCIAVFVLLYVNDGPASCLTLLVMRESMMAHSAQNPCPFFLNPYCLCLSKGLVIPVAACFTGAPTRSTGNQ